MSNGRLLHIIFIGVHSPPASAGGGYDFQDGTGYDFQNNDNYDFN